MRNIANLCIGLTVATLLAGSLEARITAPSPTNPDIWCVGMPANETAPSTENCVDSSGAFIPMVNNNQSIGTEDVVFSTGNFNAIRVSSLSVSGNTNIGGDLVVDGTLTGFEVNIATVSIPKGQVSVTATTWVGVDGSTISLTTVGTNSLVKVEYACNFSFSGVTTQGWLAIVRDDGFIADGSSSKTAIQLLHDDSGSEDSLRGDSALLYDEVATAGTYSYSLMTKTSANSFIINLSNVKQCTFSATEVK